jgi:hypothetical protein
MQELELSCEDVTCSKEEHCREIMHQCVPIHLKTRRPLIVPSYPADNSKQQQLIEKSDGQENGTKMIAGVHVVTLMASETIMAPAAPSLFADRFRLVIALISWG